MKAVAVLVLIMAAYVSAVPHKRGLISGISSLANSLSAAANSILKGTVIDDLEKVTDNIQKAGGIVVVELTRNLALAAENNLISAQDGKKILATFNALPLGDPAENDVFKTPEDFDKVVINGDAKVAEEVRTILKEMLKAKIAYSETGRDGLSRENYQFGVHLAAAHLLVGNNIVSDHGRFVIKGVQAAMKLVCNQRGFKCPVTWEDIIRGDAKWNIDG